MTAGASALRYFVFDGTIDGTAEATTKFKHSEEVLCEFVGLEEYDLAALVDEAWIKGVASHPKTLALAGKRQIDSEQLRNPLYPTVNRQGEENMSAWEFRASDVPPNIELLRGLKPRETDLIIAAGRPRRFAANSVMTYQGEPAKHLLLLWKGRARFFYETPNDKKLILKWITPGHIFGGAALVSGPSTYLVSTEAVRDSIAMEWDGPTIREFARRFPRLLENAHLIDVDYISHYVVAHAALSSQSARQRLACVLFGLATSFGQKVSGGIELEVTNEELADSASITPYTTSRLISAWTRSGAIRKHRGKILVLSPETLLRWSEGKFQPAHTAQRGN